MPASDTAGLHIVGIVQRGARNVSGSIGGPNVGDGVSALGTAGAISVDVEKTVARLNNSATDPVDITKCEQLVYVEDDNTVSATGGATRWSPVGCSNSTRLIPRWCGSTPPAPPNAFALPARRILSLSPLP